MLDADINMFHADTALIVDLSEVPHIADDLEKEIDFGDLIVHNWTGSHLALVSAFPYDPPIPVRPRNVDPKKLPYQVLRRMIINAGLGVARSRFPEYIPREWTW